MLNKTYKQTDENSHRINYYLRDILREKRQGENFTILYEGHATHILFYINLLNEKGKHILFKRNNNEMKRGEIVLTSQNETKQFLEEKYNCNIVEEFYNIKVYEIYENRSFDSCSDIQ
jgi:hypothetical protein